MSVTWINGYPLFYRLVGTATQQPPIVLIHGLASSHRDWLLQVPVLCRKRQILLVDLPGHGQSGSLPSCSVQGMATDIYRLLQRLNIQQCDVMGISMGGMVAMSLAATRPALVRKLVLVNTAPSLNDLVPAMRYLLPLRRLLAFIPMSIMARALLIHMLPGKNNAAVRHYALKYWKKNDPPTLARILDGLTRINLWSQLPDIRARTLVIRGQHDSFVLSSALKMCKSIPQAELITVKGSGHATVADRFAQFNDILCEFLYSKESHPLRSTHDCPDDTPY